MKKIGLAEKFFYYFGLFLVERDPAGGIISKKWVCSSMIALCQPAFTCSKSTMEAPENLFKVNNKKRFQTLFPCLDCCL